MTHIACKTKVNVQLVVRLFMHSCPGNWYAIESAIVYYARAVYVFSAGIKCRYCSYTYKWFSVAWA